VGYKFFKLNKNMDKKRTRTVIKIHEYATTSFHSEGQIHIDLTTAQCLPH